MMAWGSWDETAFEAYLPANMILAMADIAVVVADRLANLMYMNEYAARLFRVAGDASGLAGQPVLSLGLVADGDLRLVEEMTEQVLRGRSWEGTFETTRGDGTHALIRAIAVPLRHPSGDIDGSVMLAREVSQQLADGFCKKRGILAPARIGLSRTLLFGEADRVQAGIVCSQRELPDRARENGVGNHGAN